MMDPKDNCWNKDCSKHDLESLHCCIYNPEGHPKYICSKWVGKTEKDSKLDSKLEQAGMDFTVGHQPKVMSIGEIVEENRIKGMANTFGRDSMCEHTPECNCSVCRGFKGMANSETLKEKEKLIRESKEYKVPLADMLSDFHLALTEVARVTAFGNQKHGELGGWRQVVGFQRSYQNKKARHAIDGLLKDLDDESGLYCLAHEAWNALALLQDKMEQGDKRRDKQ